MPHMSLQSLHLFGHGVEIFSIILLPRGLHSPKSGTVGICGDSPGILNRFTYVYVSGLTLTHVARPVGVERITYLNHPQRPRLS